MSNHPIAGRGHGTIQENVIRQDKPDDVFNAELAADMAKRTDKLLDANIDMAVRVKQAREFMAWSASHIRGIWMDWMEESSEATKHMNQFRMAFDRESKSITATAKDVSDFFNSPDYLKAHSTLSETVTLLERFSELKKNGTLDAFADFILKVSCK